MENLFFSTNWNGKLACHCFTSIRFPSNNYAIGKEFNVYVDSKEGKLHVADNRGKLRQVIYYGTVKLLDRKQTLLKDLTDAVCKLDTGYNAEATKRLLSTMYKSYVAQHGENSAFLWLLFEFQDHLTDLDILAKQHDVTGMPAERKAALIKALQKDLVHA